MKMWVGLIWLRIGVCFVPFRTWLHKMWEFLDYMENYSKSEKEKQL